MQLQGGKSERMSLWLFILLHIKCYRFQLYIPGDINFSLA